MPEMDFNKIDDMESFSPVPKGKYFCNLTEIEDDKTTQNGDEMWRLKFTVTQGEYKGRSIWDNLIFSENAKKRVKFICARLGLDVSGKIDLTPITIINKTCFITTDVEEYIDDKGKTKERNTVLFDGYERADTIQVEEDGEPTPASSNSEDDDGEEGLPF